MIRSFEGCLPGLPQGQPRIRHDAASPGQFNLTQLESPAKSISGLYWNHRKKHLEICVVELSDIAVTWRVGGLVF